MISLAYITARKEPRFDWLFDSLLLQSGLGDIGEIIIIDRFAESYDGWTLLDVGERHANLMEYQEKFQCPLKHHAPKPNVWSGKYRLTPIDWWSTSSYRNTGLCYASGDFICLLDDRCVLLPTWLDAVREARQKQYAVCGTYEKRDGMIVDFGKIASPGKTIGEDSRFKHVGHNKLICPGTWMFGCTFALPTEWMLNVNGVDELWDSVSMEDTHFGQMLENNGYHICFDARMAIVQDRSGGTSHEMKRSSKERWPHDKEDKTHKLMEKLWKNKRSAHAWDLRAIREVILKGGTFPIPTTPTHDWFDNQQLGEMW